MKYVIKFLNILMTLLTVTLVLLSTLRWAGDDISDAFKICSILCVAFFFITMLTAILFGDKEKKEPKSTWEENIDRWNSKPKSEIHYKEDGSHELSKN